MKYFEIYKKAIVLTFILFNLLGLPFIVYSYNLNVNNNLNSPIKLYNDDLSRLSSFGQNEISEFNSDLNKENNIFDPLLNDFLLNYSIQSLPTEEKVNVIILFDDGVLRSKRINIIDNIFNKYEIINNYNLIPGVYLSCDPSELISKQASLKNAEGIIRVYKSRFYENPEFPQEDPLLSVLNSNNYPNWWVSAVGAEDLAYDGTGIRVAVVDTGIYNHPDLHIVANRSFVAGDLSNTNDDYGHGTHVAGIIGGNGSSSGGKYRGIAPGVSLINARAGDFEGLEDGAIISAIEWAVNDTANGGADADIISMSFGGGVPEYSDPMTLTISKAANDYGVILIASAGNSGPGYFTGGSPASGNDIISVGATDKNNDLASFTSWGPTFTYLGYPDVVAPGVNIISTEAPNSFLSDQKRFIGDYFDYPGNGDYIPLSGTSMACPMVSGALAILKEAYPLITPETARIALYEGAQPLSGYANDETLKYGAGLINVSASLDYLASLSPDSNDTARFFPDTIPLQPFDLLHFPRDKQSFNISVISGKANTYNVNIPNKVDGLKLNIDNNVLVFSQEDVKFSTLYIEIEQNAKPGIRTFELNITSGAVVYDSITITIEVKFPEHRVLMESFHGLNDWFPEVSFYQMDFYEFMKDMSGMNISFDYGAEYWTPNYDVNNSNSLLTEERLAQYDLILLQNPILPYTLDEMLNLKNYLDNGGNILFLGTRHQDLCVDNINDLFSVLGTDITVNEETIYSEDWLGIGASINPQSITDFNSTALFTNVDKFEWYYGNTFEVSSNSISIASLHDKTVAVAYNASTLGGKLVAFGDLHWMSEFYTSTNYQIDHENLARNLMDYFFSDVDISIQINLESERTSNAQFNLSVYIKDLITDIPIDSSILSSNLSIIVTNTGFSEPITTISLENGIAQNTTYSLSSTSYKPYAITVNFTYGSKIYLKTTKLLYFNSASVPIINSLTVSEDPVTRSPGDSTQLRVDLDSSSYTVNAYLSIYAYSFYNTKQTINKTFHLTYSATRYRYTYDPSLTDPAGLAIYYIVGNNDATNYTNPYSPRCAFEVRNHIPKFIESSSYITVAGRQTFSFDETHSGNSSYIIPVSQGDDLDFSINTTDSVTYEDPNSSHMRVSVNLFMIATTDNYINIMYPRSFPLVELNYQSSTDIHKGRLGVPYTIAYDSIAGTKDISTATNYNTNSGEGYLAILLITLIDSEGGSDDFIIIISIKASLQLDPFLAFLILGLVISTSVLVVILLVRRSRKRKRTTSIESQEYPSDYYITPSESTVYYSEPSSSEGYESGYHCPNCGYNIGTPKSFCPNCGKSLNFEKE
jgi:subtilisin family serine protease